VSLTRSPTMAATMFTGMIVMALAFWMYAIAAALARVRAIMLEREAHMQWTHELQEARE
jgi:heme exporter protein C